MNVGRGVSISGSDRKQEKIKKQEGQPGEVIKQVTNQPSSVLSTGAKIEMSNPNTKPGETGYSELLVSV